MNLDPVSLVRAVERHRDGFIADLATLVNIDCGSPNVAGVNAVGRWCARRLADLGFDVTVEPVRPVLGSGAGPVGDCVWGRLTGRRADGGRVLLMAHMDTVFDDGEAAARPFRIDGDRCHGPGVCDDKAGLLTGLYAVAALREVGFTDFGQIVFHCSSDEEIASPGSRPVIERLAGGVDAALCLECARENGDIVSARKGVAHVELEVTGRAAHAGVEPERGVNAALGAARLTVALQALNGRWPGVTVNVGVLRAGTRYNVVPAHGCLSVDLRAHTGAGLDTALAEVRRIAADPAVAGCPVAVRTTACHPTWERDPGTAALARLARDAGRDVGVPVREAATGGAAEANLTAALGVPTLDGLGPVGGDDHGPAEWVDLSSVVPRVALLAGLVARITTARSTVAAT
ncbi:MAG TPA: M20 family metallopeptidase [Mycobacteriales bacterium]